MHVFYNPIFDNSGGILSDKEAHHAIRVLRLNVGEHMEITDGNGNYGEAVITEIRGRECSYEWVNVREDGPRNFHLHIAVSPLKNNDRMEWMLEKLTELGVEEITPVVCARSERRKINRERLIKRLISAIKQSKRSRLPVLNDITDLDSFIGNQMSGQGFIAHCEDDKKKSLHDSYQSGQNATVLIGPEGDFHLDEIERCKEKGFIPISLGNARLRSETAAVYSCTAINFMNDED